MVVLKMEEKTLKAIDVVHIIDKGFRYVEE